jgi:curli biogenesis system outer membrane secretion channel CsgG
MPAGRGARPRAAILSFEFGTVEQWWSGNWDIGKGIADMLVDEILQTGQVSLLERKQIDSVMAEQNLANSNRADVTAKQAASLGKILGANMLITGSITKFGSEEKNVGGAAGSAASRFIGGASAKNTTARVALTVRVIDSTTSEILASVKGEASSNRKGLLLGTALGGNFGAINMGSKDFRETILGEATEKAVKEVAAKLVPAMVSAAK